MSAFPRWLSAAVMMLGACRAATPESQGFVSVTGGRRLHYEIYGTGKDTIVVLHGGPGLHFRYLVSPLRPLTDGRTLIYYDQRGRGSNESEPDSMALSLDTDLADLDQVRAHFRLRTMTLIGHHYGALLAGQYAAAHPDRVQKLLLLSPYFAGKGWLWQASLHSKDTVAIAHFVAARQAHLDSLDPVRYCREDWGWWFSPAQVTDPRVIRHLAESICTFSPEKIRDVPRVNRLVLGHLPNSYAPADSILSTPVLVLQGAPDNLEGSGKRWAAISRRSSTVSLPGPELFPWLDNPGLFFRTADAFLRTSMRDTVSSVSSTPGNKVGSSP